MDPGGRDRGVWASERVYRALIRLYPEEVRRRYAEEMVRYFEDLCWEERDSRGAKGMVLLWARTLPDLVFSVLKERGTRFHRNAYLPAEPGTAAKWGALSALLGGSLGIAYSLAYTLAIFVPLDWLWRGWVTMPVLMFATLLSVLGTFGLYGTLVVHSGRPDALSLSGATLGALSAVSILALYAYTTAEMLGWLWTPGEGTSWWEMQRTVLLQEIGMGACVLGLLLLGVSAFRARLFGRLRALPLAVAPLWPASIGLLILLNRSGMEYLASLSGTLPFFGAALSGWVMLTYHPTERAVVAGGAPGSVSEVGNYGSTSGERATAGPRRSSRQWNVPRARAEWLLLALSLLLMCVGAYAVRDTLLKTFGGMPPVLNEGPLSDESQRLGPQKTASGARVTLKQAYAEEKAVVIGVVMEDLEGDRSIAGHPAELEPDFRLTDESGTEFRLDSLGGHVGATDAPKSFKAGFNAEEGLEPAQKHRFRLEVSLVEAVTPSRDFWGSNGEERPPPEPVGKPFVFDFRVPVRGAPVVEVSQKDTASGVTLTLDRVNDSPGKPEAIVCYEAPDDEHSWFISGGEGTYAAGDWWGTEIQGVPPAKCQTLQLKGPLEGRTLVEVTSLEGMPDCRAAKAEALEACDKKIGEKTIRGPWRFEFEVPDPAGGHPAPRDAPPVPREADGGRGGA
ncbi:MAG TPA: hypothetical protein VN178_12720 [Rubrobacter sp.]|nr:hypothetical protein [Rubrobacter sp.]